MLKNKIKYIFLFYFEKLELIKKEDDEVLFAIAEEIGNLRFLFFK